MVSKADPDYSINSISMTGDIEKADRPVVISTVELEVDEKNIRCMKGDCDLDYCPKGG